MPRLFERRLSPRVLLALAVSACVCPAAGATQWIRLSTPDFDLYSSSGEKAAREILRNFEEVHGFFQRASPVREGSGDPVRIVDFSSDRLIQPFRVNSYSPAWFIGAPDRDYIVLDNSVKFEFRVAIHEYMHLIVRRSGLRLPVWLNEGWADVYSTLRPVNNKDVAVGDLIDSRMQELATNKWLSFAELTTVDHRSAVYNESSRAGIFYAESWALVHMLYLAPDYQQNFGKFVLALNSGKSATDALGIAWQRSPDQVFADLRAYFDRRKIYGRVFETPLTDKAAEPTVTQAGDFEAALMLADLLAASNKPKDAEQAYQKLASVQPASADLARSMGYLALGQRDRESARVYFGKAFDEGETDPRMCFQLAQMDHEANQPPARVIAELERTLRSQPDKADARMELGIEYIGVHRFDEGIRSLVDLHTITSARASNVYCSLAYGRLETGDLEGARSNLETCRRYAKDGPQKKASEEVARLLTARAKPEAAVHLHEQIRTVNGIVRGLDCSPEGNRLQVQIGDKIVNFDLPEPDAVELTNRSRATFDFVCGPQKPFEAVLDFAPPRSAVETSAGIIRRMAF